ncbi:hypothetical protein B0I32_1704 [Nonomuraea fuscirosea]|uniref:Uncharacterized protein n=1 Tax=Nonomuraea fuscirosea TaxID=1291556 RepID=A0A2T0LID8_9ACTN|nr:hypothetical protein [Nonomuraea fuscirosea]PRX42178.1 hypothetical protein B0I32_1704 [Nonomuraea fuscirosea]
MGSLLEELARRQAESRHRIEELRERLAEVRARLEAEEDRLSRLLITQEMVEEILGDAARFVEEPAGEGGEGEVADVSEAEVVRRGVVTVPPWQPELGVSVLPRTYRDVLEILADAAGAMRAVKISAALGQGESAAKVESLRSKLKRLVERGWLAEGDPGMFTLTEQVRRQMAG